MHQTNESPFLQFYQYVTELPLIEFVTTRLILAVTFVGAFVSTGIPAALAALSVISLAVFSVFEVRRVQFRRTVMSRVNACSVPSLDSSLGQQRAIIRALAKTGDSLFVLDTDGCVVAAAGDTYESLGKSTDDIVGKKFPPIERPDLNVSRSSMVLDSKPYTVIKASKT